MGKIQVMADSLANKIAAGEVVERPASVVKELVENAIDAGAKQIEVEVVDGGLSSIRVSDNGEGMDATDLEQAFLRHATSKMLHEKDLFRIRTLGFRGEALPSIAAVSKVEVTSRTQHEILGNQLILESGKVQARQQVAHPVGTTFVVRDLFFNTPARLKYIKSIQTEFHHIQDYVNRLALGHPQISFVLKNEGKLVLRTSGNGDLLNVIYSIYGLDVAKKMIPIHGDHLDFHIDGFVGKPEVVRSSRSYMTILVNGRYVRSLLMQKAILDGYHTLLPVHKYPFVVLNINMDPSLVDVNVHPAKLEIRFSKEEELAKWLKGEIRTTLLKSSLIPDTVRKSEPKQSVYTQPKLKLSSIPNLAEKIYGADVIKEANVQVDPLDRSQHFLHSIEKEMEGVSEEPRIEEIVEINDRTHDTRQIGPNLEPLAQLHGTYILAQNEEGLYLIDQHAAQERINYERIRKRLSEPSRSGQILAIPYSYETTVSEAAIIRTADNLFRELGIIQEPFGERTFLVREIPDWFIVGKEAEQVDEIVQLVLEGKGNFTLADIRDRTAQLMACKASIKANQFITKAEMADLLYQLSLTENPFTCPHGRPIMVHFSLYEIEKMFKRVM